MAIQGTSTAPRIHPALDTTVEKLLKSSLAKKTHEVYHIFHEFVIKHFGSLQPVPSTVNMIVGFIAHLHKLGYSGSTITTHVSAISYYFSAYRGVHISR